MRVLVFAQKLIVGGANVTALSLADELQGRGHEVSVFAEPGPMVEDLAARGLPYHEAPGDTSLTARWPSRRAAAALRRVARETGAQVIHTYEWSACLDALVGAYLLDGVPLVSSIMSMQVPRYMPKHIPLIVGTRVLRDQLTRQGYPNVTLVEPSVDAGTDNPTVDGEPFRRALDIPEDAFVISIISRLSGLKLESAVTAVQAVERLADRADVRLVIAGEGSGEDDIRRRANGVNRRAGREVVLLPGVLGDPRTAYAASDVVLGMGGSALRGLAFGKPLVVVGERGYLELFTPGTSGEFVVQGFWGLGDGDHCPDHLVELLEGLIKDPDRRAELGAFGRRFVCERFALPNAAMRLEAVLRATTTLPPAQRQAEVASVIARLSALRLKWWVQRRGSALHGSAGSTAPSGPERGSSPTMRDHVVD